MNAFKWQVASEDSLIVYAQRGTLAQRNDNVRKMDARLRDMQCAWLVDTVPAYDSLLIQFNPLMIDLFALKLALNQVMLVTEKPPQMNTGIVSVQQDNTLIKPLPVWYGSSEDSDLKHVAAHHGMTIEDVIECHTSVVYHVYCCGFAPGFAYMGEVSSSIAMPRRSTPRKKVPKGAVAIADRQTAIYPSESPGGWNILGLCPVDQFNRDATPPNQLNVGDKVKFEAIDAQQYRELISEGLR